MEELISKLKEVKYLNELEELNIGRINYDISYRGGTLYFRASDIEKVTGISEYDMSSKVGVYSNYLGGGLRGSIMTTSYNNELSMLECEFLYELGQACKRVYINLENEDCLNDEETIDGEINWEARGTNLCRESGITSAY